MNDTSEAYISLYDDTTQTSVIYYNEYTSSAGGRPSTVTLNANDQYLLGAITTASNYVYPNHTGSDADNVNVSFSLSAAALAAPEPSPLLPTGLAVVVGLFHVYRRRRVA